MSAERPTCETCLAFDEVTHTCRRIAPTCHVIDGDVEGLWPTVGEDEWCMSYVGIQRRRVYQDDPQDFFDFYAAHNPAPEPKEEES